MTLEEALLINKYFPNPHICGYDDNGKPSHLFRNNYCVFCSNDIQTIKQKEELYDKAQEIIKGLK
jgi:hypothetical protein